MVEFEKTGPDIKNALFNSGIFFCYIDDFYTGNSGEIEINALLREVRRYLEQSVRLNVNEMMDAAYRATRIVMTDAEQKQFFNKHIKPMAVDIDEDGNLTIQLRGR
jgi:biotin-(acetyl-CoA carboxylase) ligase